MVFFTGISIDKVASLDQETRNYVGRKLLHLTLMELFVFRFMQARCLYNYSGFLIVNFSVTSYFSYFFDTTIIKNEITS